MKFNINKISSFAFAIAFVSIIYSCGNKSQSDVKEGAKTAIKAEEEHGHEELSIATLTAEQIKTVGVQLGDVEQKELTATIKANGMLSVPNNNKANATSLYGGVVKGMNIQIGDYVKKGQTIATITNPQFVQSQEEFLTIASRITFSEQEVQRQKTLNEGNAGAIKNLQNATAELNTLRTRKASLQRQLQMMGINPNAVSNGNMQSIVSITSPISGTVSNVFAKIGSYVDGSSPVIEVVDNSSIHLDLQVFEKDLPQVKVGQTIHFTLTNNPTTEYDATVFSIGSSFENDSKTVAVHCKVNGKKTGLIDGMNITGIVSLSNVTTPAVPNDAIVSAEGKYFVFVVTDKQPEAHEDEAGHEHKEGHKDDEKKTNFERIEVLKGVSDMGYTAVTFIKDFPKNAKIVVKGAFFVNAKMSNTGGHEH
ncbi:MAG: efflux RND transporter periplasmic adaptor subunit [Flavobacteriales bacterium]|nr:MAG: efflux RND transporter periplasmic adaptor subunit [Flavobacteriales bacterium]